MQRKIALIASIITFLLSVWTVSAGNIPTNVPVVSQRFENGEMIYLEDSGDIYVLSNLSGNWWLFESGAYGTMSPNNNLNAPYDRYAPENGFGRIWANNVTIRNELGWAVLPEIGFNMDMRFTDTGNIYMTRLNNIRLHLSPSGTWRTLSFDPDGISANIKQFAVSHERIASGETITISYDWENADQAQISITSVENPDYRTDAYINLSNTTGTLEWVIPETVEGDIEISLLLRNENIPSTFPHTPTGAPAVVVVASESFVVDVFQTSDFFNESYAAYQEYEHGFMIWREDTGAVQIFYENSRTWQIIAEHVYAGNSGYQETAPDGCVVPVNAFGKVWHSYFDVQEGLGCAVAQEIGYTLSIDGDGLGNFEFSLPDGDTITITGNTWE